MPPDAASPAAADALRFHIIAFAFTLMPQRDARMRAPLPPERDAQRSAVRILTSSYENTPKWNAYK